MTTGVTVLYGEMPREIAENANCGGCDTEIFFSIIWHEQHQARRICDGCPVAADCLNWALSNGIDHGIWGGLNPKERRKLKRGVPLATILAKRWKPVGEDKICAWCGIDFLGLPVRKYCGNTCSARAGVAAKRARRAAA